MNRPLYEAIEKILNRTIPLWNNSLVRFRHRRIDTTAHTYLEPEPTKRDGESDDDFEIRHSEWVENRSIIPPEPDNFDSRRVISFKQISLRNMFAEKGLQVTVKLANIELTPEKPKYDTGPWHIEGQLNEHICATAIYYYDSENITESALSFRQRACTDMDIFSYEQDMHDFLQPVFGFGDDVEGRNDSNITQHLGSVSTREGRLVTFPNILQHRVSPFSLADRSKPGHRKILAFFLRREDWWSGRRECIAEISANKLPAEIQDMVSKDISAISSMTMDEAKQYRLELMEERKAAKPGKDYLFEVGYFDLCEH